MSLHSFIAADVPIVAVYNNLETFYPFLSRAHDPQVLDRRRYHGDRGLFWLGERKLIITTVEIPQWEQMCARWGYRHTRNLAPKLASNHLSVDILNDLDLLEALVKFAGPARTIQLVPYATTSQFLQLAQTLREQYGLTVLLPESPHPERLWVRDYIDTKSGFRTLAAQWLAAAAGRFPLPTLPYGLVCQNSHTAAGVVRWFAGQGRDCIVKADRGESGLGHLIMGGSSANRVSSMLAENDFLGKDAIVVEEYIHSSNLNSPSLEFFVPPLEQGEPQISHLASQIFRGCTQFCGALISKETYDAPWYPQLAQSGLLFARYLQEMGYVGHFDLDTVVNDRDELFLVEINARRTGSTYVHEFGKLALGANYLDQAVLLSNTLPSGAIQDAEELFHVLDDVLYTGTPSSSGVVISNPSALLFNEFGCIIIASSSEEALRLQSEVQARVVGIRQNVSSYPIL